MSTRQEVYKLIIEKKDNKEIAAALNISVRSVQLYRKEYEKDLNESEIKNESESEKKKRKEKAKVLIETGASLKEAATQSNTTIDIVKRLSSKEKLQVKQLDYLKSFREQYREEITKNKKDRLKLNNKAKEKIEYTLNLAEDISKDTQKLIVMNEETEQKIFELDRIERLERFELEKVKYKDSRLNIISEELANLTDDDIEKILQIIEKSKEVDKNE